MNKIKIILYFMVISLFLINPVSANIFPNYDFESGTIGGLPTSWNGSGDVTLTNLTRYNGINSVYYDYTAMIYTANIDLTGISKLSFYYRITSAPQGYSSFYLTVDGEEQFDTPTGVQPSWTLHECDVSAYSGTYTIILGSQAADGYIDYIFEDESGPVFDCEINFYPDISIAEEDPSEIYYYLNDTMATYDIDIIGSWCTNISGNTYCIDNIVYGNLEAPINPQANYHDVWGNDYNNTEYEICIYQREYYAYNLYFLNLLACDTQTVIYNTTEYPDPTPEPTPDPTPEPTPTNTPTPQPTATPQPDPEPINETLNTTFIYEYYNRVNETVDGVFEPVYNFTDYIAQPLISLNNTLWNFSTEMNNSFNSSSSHLGLSTNMMFIIMFAIPPKIISVFTYYLIWVIILLIFKAET